MAFQRLTKDIIVNYAAVTMVRVELVDGKWSVIISFVSNHVSTFTFETEDIARDAFKSIMKQVKIPC